MRSPETRIIHPDWIRRLPEPLGNLVLRNLVMGAELVASQVAGMTHPLIDVNAWVDGTPRGCDHRVGLISRKVINRTTIDAGHVLEDLRLQSHQPKEVFVALPEEAELTAKQRARLKDAVVVRVPYDTGDASKLQLMAQTCTSPVVLMTRSDTMLATTEATATVAYEFMHYPYLRALQGLHLPDDVASAAEKRELARSRMLYSGSPRLLPAKGRSLALGDFAAYDRYALLDNPPDVRFGNGGAGDAWGRDRLRENPEAVVLHPVLSYHFGEGMYDYEVTQYQLDLESFARPNEHIPAP